MIDLFAEKGQTDIHLKHDPVSGLQAIIAIHNTQLGPALGGCRFIEYDSTDQAITDALRLAEGMSYKAALADVPQGGGKAVIIKPKHWSTSGSSEREALFDAFGDFVEELNGRYVTAIDSGTSPQDMDVVHRHTNYATSTTELGDPSGYTATGVFVGIKAAVKAKLDKDSLQDVHIAIQGLGNVGGPLAEMLHDAGARLSITDIDQSKCAHYAKTLDANVVEPEDIYSLKCDVFAPCGLGAIINDDTIEQLNCSIVAGSANNQLARDEHGIKLHQMGILYAPDYVINAGGLIHASLSWLKRPKRQIEERTLNIANTLTQIFDMSQATSTATVLVANELAKAKLNVH